MAQELSLELAPATDSWGPSTTAPQFEGMPYAAFSKSDRVGRAADFSTNAMQRFGGRHRSDRDAAGNDQFNYRFDTADAAAFQLVDTTGRGRRGPRRWRNNRPPWVRRNFRPWMNRNAAPETGEPQNKHGRFSGQSSHGRRYDKLNRARRMYRRPNNRGPEKQPSVKVEAHWAVREQFDLSELNKLRVSAADLTPEDLMWCGKLRCVNEACERVTRKQFFVTTTTADPVIERLAREGAGNVFMIGDIVAHLMTCARTVRGWDLRAHRVGNSLFIDKRDESQFDYHGVSESAFDPPTEEEEDPQTININTVERLAIECTRVAQCLQEQVLRTDLVRSLDNPTPFTPHADAAASVGYRYRRWRLSDGMVLVARTELHGISVKQGKQLLARTFPMFQFDPKLCSGLDWKGKVDSQRGSILATELKNNSAKLARAAANCVISGAHVLNLGFVSRINRLDPTRHHVLGVQAQEPIAFARQLTLDLDNAWGVITSIAKMLLNMPEGEYVIMRDSNKPVVRIYEVGEAAQVEGDSWGAGAA